MPSISVRTLSDELPFGARVTGVDRGTVRDEGVRARLNALFEDRGLIVFEDVEPALEMQAAVSQVFGPLKDHSYKGIVTVEGGVPGVMELKRSPGETDVFEIDGCELSGWLPWHFDACYDRALNRAGVLRVVESPPEGGLTGFADGVQLYQAVSPTLRDRFEDLEILYHPKLMFTNMRYGRPRRFAIRHLGARTNNMFEVNAEAPRAIHPAVWRRATGEKVLHLAPWQADGIFGHEDPEGDALLEAMFAEINRKAAAYFHAWKPTDLVIWDNWRFLHSASGHSPRHGRLAHRTTIEGDYGLGRFETEAKLERATEMMA
jgi:taurine dioxygenase